MLPVLLGWTTWTGSNWSTGLTYGGPKGSREWTSRTMCRDMMHGRNYSQFAWVRTEDE